MVCTIVPRILCGICDMLPLTGERGASVRQLGRLTGTDIKSWYEDATGARSFDCGTRTFLLQVSAKHYSERIQGPGLLL